MIDADEIMERIETVQRESLQRLDDDIAILTKYLKTKGAPKEIFTELDGLSNELRECWDSAVERIAVLMEG